MWYNPRESTAKIKIHDFMLKSRPKSQIMYLGGLISKNISHINRAKTHTKLAPMRRSVIGPFRPDSSLSAVSQTSYVDTHRNQWFIL